MQNHWTKDDVAAAWQRFERTYAHDPVAYRFLCGHCIPVSYTHLTLPTKA